MIMIIDALVVIIKIYIIIPTTTIKAISIHEVVMLLTLTVTKQTLPTIESCEYILNQTVSTLEDLRQASRHDYSGCLSLPVMIPTDMSIIAALITSGFLN